MILIQNRPDHDGCLTDYPIHIDGLNNRKIDLSFDVFILKSPLNFGELHQLTSKYVLFDFFTFSTLVINIL